MHTLPKQGKSVGLATALVLALALALAHAMGWLELLEGMGLAGEWWVGEPVSEHVSDLVVD